MKPSSTSTQTTLRIPTSAEVEKLKKNLQALREREDGTFLNPVDQLVLDLDAARVEGTDFTPSFDFSTVTNISSVSTEVGGLVSLVSSQETKGEITHEVKGTDKASPVPCFTGVRVEDPASTVGPPYQTSPAKNFFGEGCLRKISDSESLPEIKSEFSEVQVTPLKRKPVSQLTPFSGPVLPTPTSTTPIVKIGYFCFTDKFRSPYHSVLESEGKFFRVDLSNHYSPPPKPMTPVIFSTTFHASSDLGLGKIPTFVGTFKKHYSDGSGNLHPHLIEGIFVSSGSGKMTFEWNPLKAFRHPIRTTVLSNYMKNLKMNSPVRLRFSTRPPSSNGVSFPFPKDFQPLSLEDVCVEDPSTGLLPNEFLHELAKHPMFNFHVGIGISDNEIIPTLDYTDFYHLNRTNSVNWNSISKYIFEKYEVRSKDELYSESAPGFLSSLHKHSSNPHGQKSIFLFPGRWEGFGFKEAQVLAQKILTTTNFLVFIGVRAHPLSTKENAHEMNPQFMGNSSLSDVDSRIFYDSPVGMGEATLGGDVCYNFAHNVRKFLFLKMKKATHGPIFSKTMFEDLQVFTPLEYKPAFYSSSASDVGDDYFLASFSKGEKKVLDALSKARVHKYPVVDHERSWSNFVTYQLYNPEEKLSRDFVQNLINPPPSEGKNTAPCVGKYFCEAETASQKCVPTNNIRIVKLGDVSAFRNIEQRTVPLSILQKLLLIDQALPLSNFYFKIQLRPGVSDKFFLEQVTKYNQKEKTKLFHSFFNGSDTFSLAPLPLPVLSITPPLIAPVLIGQSLNVQLWFYRHPHVILHCLTLISGLLVRISVPQALTGLWALVDPLARSSSSFLVFVHLLYLLFFVISRIV